MPKNSLQSHITQGNSDEVIYTTFIQGLRLYFDNRWCWRLKLHFDKNFSLISVLEGKSEFFFRLFMVSQRGKCIINQNTVELANENSKNKIPLCLLTFVVRMINFNIRLFRPVWLVFAFVAFFCFAWFADFAVQMLKNNQERSFEINSTHRTASSCNNSSKLLVSKIIISHINEILLNGWWQAKNC